jgi:phosphomethylpyrimidine synthase
MTRKSNGRIEKRPLLLTGPFTDPNIEIDIRKGLPRIREQWILDRNDVEELSEISSEYGKERLNDVKLNDLRFSTYTNRCALKELMSPSCIMQNKV